MNKYFPVLIVPFLMACSGDLAKAPSGTREHARGIFSGNEPASIQEAARLPVVRLSIESKSSISCSGIHIGKGWILTAYHCFASCFYFENIKPTVTVTMRGGQTPLGTFSPVSTRYFIHRQTDEPS